jgi:hypothetical protein
MRAERKVTYPVCAVQPWASVHCSAATASSNSDAKKVSASEPFCRVTSWSTADLTFCMER